MKDLSVKITTVFRFMVVSACIKGQLYVVLKSWKHTVINLVGLFRI